MWNGQQREEEFIKAYQSANSALKKEAQFKKAQELWNKVKGNNYPLAKGKLGELKTLEYYLTEKYSGEFLDENNYFSKIEIEKNIMLDRIWW